MHELERSLPDLLGTRLRRAEGAWRSYLLMKKFPWSAGRLDWQRARNVVRRPAVARESRNDAGITSKESRGTAEITSVERAHDMLRYLNECMREHALTDSWVVFVADSFDHEYEVQWQALPELLQAVRGLRDHRYIFALDVSWCAMWSVEGTFYFGLPPLQPALGSVDASKENSMR
jgi:hypothetical protein